MPEPGRSLPLRADDFGAFRAADPGTGDLLLLRPAQEGLVVERPDEAGGVRTDLVPWDDVRAVHLARAPVGRSRVPVTRIELRSGASLDFADALAPGAQDLPPSLEPDGPPLRRVERYRLFTATVVAAAGLAPETSERFHRGARRLPVPELALRPRVLPKWAPPVLLALSVLVLMALGLDVASALAVTAAIYLHEFGHAVAMRVVGMRVRGMLFLPFLGAATLPEHGFPSRWAEVRVALAGPLTGLPVAGAALLLWNSPPPLPVRWGLLTAVAINLLNLAPLFPLDGGRVLLAATAGLPRAGRYAAAFAPPLLLLVALTVLWDRPAGLGIWLLVVASFVMTRLALRRQSLHAWLQDVPFHLPSVRGALRDVTHALHGSAREDVEGGVPAQPLTAAQIGLVVAVYAAEVAVLVGATAAIRPLLPELEPIVDALSPAGMPAR